MTDRVSKRIAYIYARARLSGSLGIELGGVCGLESGGAASEVKTTVNSDGPEGFLQPPQTVTP